MTIPSKNTLLKQVPI